MAPHRQETIGWRGREGRRQVRKKRRPVHVDLCQQPRHSGVAPDQHEPEMLGSARVVAAGEGDAKQGLVDCLGVETYRRDHRGAAAFRDPGAEREPALRTKRALDVRRFEERPGL